MPDDIYRLGRIATKSIANNLLDVVRATEIACHEGATMLDAHRRLNTMECDAIDLLERLGYDPDDSDLWGSEMRDVVIPLLTAALHLANPSRDAIEEIL